MKNLSKIVLMTIAFGLLVFSADSAVAQRRSEYRQDRREARREYRQDVRKARREYREDIRDARRDRYRDNYYRSNRYNRYGVRGRGYNYYGRRPYVGNNGRYVYRNGRVYRRW